MKRVEMTSGLIYGDVIWISVCSKCGCENLYVQLPGVMFRRKRCPECNHELDWSSKN